MSGLCSFFHILGQELKKEMNHLANLKLDLGSDTLHIQSLADMQKSMDDCWERLRATLFCPVQLFVSCQGPAYGRQLEL